MASIIHYTHKGDFSKSDAFLRKILKSNVVNGVPIALLIQYGHGTGTGGYVQGRDYIKPAIRPIFDNLAKDLWEEVTRS